MTGDSEVASELLDVLFVLQVSPELRLEYVSRSVRGFTGHSADEFVSDATLWLRLVDPRDREVVLGALNAEPGVARHATFRWAGPDGRTMWAQQVTRKVVREDGVEAVYGALNHLTDQQIAEAQAGLEGRYSMVPADAPDVVLRIDLQGRIVWVSESVRAMAGWAPRDLVGQNAMDFLDVSGRAVVSALGPRVLAGEDRTGVVLRIRTADRGGRFVSVSARPIIDEGTGEPAGVIASWRDVDELVKARLQAESERQILRAALDAQLDPQVVLEAVRNDRDRVVDFRVVEINPSACDELDVTRADVVGKQTAALGLGIQDTEQWEILLDVVQHRRPLVLNEQPFITIRGGLTRRFDVRAVPVHDGLSLTWRDVTERHQRAAALAASEAMYRLLLEESSDMVSFHTPDGAVEWVSPAVERLLGWSPDESVHTLLDLIHRDDAPGVWAARDRLLAGEEAAGARFRMRSRNRGWRWLEATARAVREDGVVTSMVVFSRDVQDQIDHETALATSQERYRLLAENATDVVYRTTLDGTTEWVSEGVERVLGFTPAEFVGRNGRDLVSPEDREFVDRATAEVLAGTRSSARFRMPTKDGGTRWVESTIHAIRGDDGEPVGFVGGWRDVQAEVEAEQALDTRARTDGLTGLANRDEVMARLARLLAVDNHARTGSAVAFCDLDGFKTVNDTRGHAVGDALLRAVADRIGACVRAGDTVARVGGDEFLVVLDGVRDLHTASRVSEKIREAVAGPLLIDGRALPITISIGVTMVEIHDDVDGLVARADRGMYEAKQAGRGRVVAVP
ncbi:MAG: PAS domain S-box protein [Actinobacteria bacterium]|nr:PAS domain S-box protein [Actinomycetota bacterium]